jgi:hypothetical protein
VVEALQMLPSEQYRHNAAECVLMIDETLDPEDRLVLMQAAAAWLRLAEQCEQDSQSEVGKQVPHRRIGANNRMNGRVRGKSSTSQACGSTSPNSARSGSPSATATPSSR